MSTYNVQYAFSFGIEKFEGLWKIEFPHPLDVGLKKVAYLPMTTDDPRIGQVIDGISVAQPGTRLVEVMKWLYGRITKYPYYWPWEGTYVDKFDYDFEVEFGVGENEPVERVEISQIAYEIVKNQLKIQPPGPPPSHVVGDDELVEPGGVLVKLVVTLDRSQPVSEISIAPFTQYPLEVVSVMYEEDIETFHPRKEILLTSNTRSTESMTFKFPEVLARRFTIILRQPNYVKNTYLVLEQDLNKKELWEKIAQREAEVTLDLTDGRETISNVNRLTEVDQYTGWDIYLLEMIKRQADLRKWKNKVEAYRKALPPKQNNTENSRFKLPISDFRREFYEVIQRYLTQFNQKNQSNDSSNQKSISFYNKNLRNWIDWMRRRL